MDFGYFLIHVDVYLCLCKEIIRGSHAQSDRDIHDEHDAWPDEFVKD